MPALTPTDWLSLLHPVLMILFVYPVVGATIRLGTLARERRLDLNPLPPTVGVEHAEHGRWATTGVVVAILLALLVNFLRDSLDPTAVLAMGVSRRLALVTVALVALGACLALWRVQKPGLRALLALSSWSALLLIGSQPEVDRVTNNPLLANFWRSHYWSGILLCGLLLFAVAARPEIQRSLAMRGLHVSAAFLVALLLAVQAITGCRNLLMMSLFSSPG